MAASRPFDLEALPALFDHLTVALGDQRGAIDELNVFPVPDGDTGTNLLHTVRAGRDAAREAAGTDVATAVRRALLRGARGNSGVIMSQVLAAFVAAVEGGPLTVARLGPMLADARDRAYEAVAAPVQGTILSALDAAVDGVPAGDDDLAVACAAVAKAVDRAVVATEHELEANRRAEVVDAGARGFAVVWHAVCAYVVGAEPPQWEEDDRRDADGRVDHGGGGDLGPAYEVMYVVELASASEREATVAALREQLGGLGDSVVVVGDEALVQAHLHTDDVGAAVEAGAAFGTTTDVRVTRFADDPRGCVNDESGADEDAEPRAAVGYVAVVPGPGIAAMVADLGATTVHGAAGDLPNVAVLLEAVGRTRADEVVLLPGHPNVVPTARQAAEVSRAEGGRAMPVVGAATSVPAVLAALMAVTVDDLDLDQLEQAAGGARSGEVVAAVRDADTAVGRVRAGQWLGVVGTEVVASADDRTGALLAVVEAVADEAELVTLIAGREVGAEEAEDAVDAVGEQLGRDVEVEHFDGGQHPAAWIVGVE